MPMKKELYNKAAKLLSIAILISAFLFWAFEERFDENTWSSEPSIRYKMADDIIAVSYTHLTLPTKA